MGEGKRSQEEKGWQKALRTILKFVPILCIIAVVVFFIILFDMKNKVDEKKGNSVNSNAITNTMAATNNTSVNNTNAAGINTAVSNDNTSGGNVTQNIEAPSTSNSQNTEPPISRPEEDPDIKQAKEIFVDFWGQDQNSNIEAYKDGNGNYVVRVTSNQTGSNKYFKVDINTKSVTEY